MKTHPTLFEGEGPRGRGEPKNEALLFQSTVDIHFQHAHKTLFQSRLTFNFKTRTKHKNCESSRVYCV